MTEKGLRPIRRRPFFTEVQMPMRITNALLFVEGEFRFDLAAGTLRDAAGNENRAQSYTVRFEKNPA